MLIDYYKKYKISRNIDEHKKFLNSVRNNNINKIGLYGQFLKKNEEGLDGAEESGDTEKIKIATNNLKSAKVKIFELDKQNSMIEQLMNANEGTFDSTKEDQISDLYFSIRFQEILRLKKDEIDKIDALPESEEKKEALQKLKQDIIEIVKVRNILVNTQQRKKYNYKLEYQEYLEFLEQNRQARIAAGKKYVKNLLGDDFNPDMSFCTKDTNGRYSWKVNLYDRPEKLFVGNCKHPKIAQLNQEIYAYRYGSFEYETLFRPDGKPTHSDSCCEIIGVTKRAIDGTETTNFVIAPLRYVESLNFEKGASRQNPQTPPSPQKPPNPQTPYISKKSRGILQRIFSKSANKSKNVNKKGSEKRSYTGARPKMPIQNRQKIILKAKKYEVKDEDREFFGNVYLSDYLINNAVENNAHYLGTYTYDKPEKKVTFDSPTESDRVNACYFAKTEPGILVKKKAESTKEYEIENIERVFEYLDLYQQSLVELDKNKATDEIEKDEDVKE